MYEPFEYYAHRKFIEASKCAGQYVNRLKACLEQGEPFNSLAGSALYALLSSAEAGAAARGEPMQQLPDFLASAEFARIHYTITFANPKATVEILEAIVDGEDKRPVLQALSQFAADHLEEAKDNAAKIHEEEEEYRERVYARQKQKLPRFGIL